MEPIRDSHVTLVDLLDRVLDKGLVLYADIIVSVAGVPLIGVNLRAALAGMETMLKYGVMQEWDQRTRAWEQEQRRAKELSTLSGEQLRLKMLGSYYHSQGIYRCWRQGYFYLTDRKIALCLPSFDEVLFETPLEKIRGLSIGRGNHSARGEREHLCLLLEGGDVAWLHALDTRQLKDAIEREMAALGLTCEEMPARALPDERAAKLLTEGEEISCAGKMWHLMALPGPGGVTHDTWRPGYLYVTSRRLCWWHDFEGKVGFETPLEAVAALAVERKDLGPPLNEKDVLDVIYETEQAKRVASFSGKGLPEWEQALNRTTAGERATLRDETDTCPQCGREALVKELLESGCDKCGWVSPRPRKDMLRVAISS